eukprot:TRINITY_DN14334_c0_g1_i1.p1 TRINITY_DN14334_c0_g1~~TRINITY_DN14334_c0_g1_i1.p1  ORF type:complete len:437 (+),score=67.12 TRINITY_DN14334_c0_g1_i1:106-1416(+)
MESFALNHLDSCNPSGRQTEGPNIDSHPIAADCDSADMEQIYLEPYGIPHKRIGATALPPMLKVSSIAELCHSWSSEADDVLFVLPPGLTPNFRLLETLFTIAGDPLVESLRERGELGMPCISSRLLERAATDAIEKPSSVCESRRCFFTSLPPWLIPIGSFDKILVFLADPRYLILRERCVWDLIQKSVGDESCSADAPDTSDYLRIYMQNSLSHLGSEELQRDAEWAVKEHEQQDRVKIVFAEDFISDVAAALEDVACFLVEKEPGCDPRIVLDNVQAATDKAMAVRGGGLFHSCSEMSELEHFHLLVREFEDILTCLPDELLATWHCRVSVWAGLPNHRMVMLGLSLQLHTYNWSETSPNLMTLHNAGFCRPCKFYQKAWHRDDCPFCHHQSHRDCMRRRPGKSERDRQKRQQHRQSPSQHDPSAAGCEPTTL